MQGLSLSPCYLCKQSLSDSFILPTCGHTLCYRCFPLLLYSNIRKGLDTEFLKNAAIHKCLVCGSGEFALTKAMLGFFNSGSGSLGTIEKKSLCEACEKVSAKSKCKQCNQNYCENCWDFIHKVNLRFATHQFEHLNAPPKKIQCPCLTRPAEDFCLQCESAFCKICSIIDHKGHRMESLAEISSKRQQLSFPAVRAHLDGLIKSIEQVKNDSLKQASLDSSHFEKAISTFTAEITSILTKYKEKALLSFSQEIEALKANFGLVLDSLNFLRSGINENLDFLPNIIYQLFKNFSPSVEKRQISTNPLKGSTHLLSETLNEIKKKVVADLLPMAESMKLILQNSLLISISSQSLSSEEKIIPSLPQTILTNSPTNLVTSKFDTDRFKCELLVFIPLENASLIAMPGPQTGGSFPINIYDLGTKQLHSSLKNAVSMISTVGIYPSYPKANEKKWLFSGEKAGTLRVYEEAKDSKSFIAFFFLETGAEISIAVLFEDKFNETDKNETATLLAMIGFANPSSPIKIHRLVHQGNQVLKVIMNYKLEPCWCFNFLFDEIKLKSSIFIGHSSVISSFSLSSNECKHYVTKSPVTSIRFLLEFTSPAFAKRFMVFSQMNNLISIFNLETNLLLRQLSLERTVMVYDLCIWRSEKSDYLLVATGNNELKVLKFESLEVVWVKTCKGTPLNVRKGTVKDIQRQNRECILVLEVEEEKGVKEFRAQIYK